MGHYVKVSGKGQITLPAEIRKKLGLESGSFLEIKEEEGVYKIVPQEGGIRKLKGSVPVEGKQNFKHSRHRAMEELANEKEPGD